MQLFTTAFLKHCLLSFWKNIPPHQQPPSLAISSCSSCSAAKDRKASRLVAHTTRKSPWNVTRLWVPSVNSCHICLAACTTFCSNVQSKICRWTTAFLFSCRVCFYSLSLLFGQSVHPSIHPCFWQGCLQNTLFCYQPALTFLIPCLVRSHSQSYHHLKNHTLGSIIETRNWILNMAADQARKLLPDVLPTKIKRKRNF